MCYMNCRHELRGSNDTAGECRWNRTPADCPIEAAEAEECSECALLGECDCEFCNDNDLWEAK